MDNKRGKLAERVIDAQVAEDLVIFAGAGVSVPEPSGLPLFDELADMVADRVARDHRSASMPVDHFLGQLAEQKLPVHEIVQEIIGRPESKPNHMHMTLLRLFRRVEAMRVVTTNFDNHFTTAAGEMSPQTAISTSLPRFLWETTLLESSI